MDVNVNYRVGVGGNIAGVDWRINEDYLSEKIGKALTLVKRCLVITEKKKA